MFGVVKDIAARHVQAAELNDWNHRNLCRAEMSGVALASRQATCLELVGRLLCCLASSDVEGEREAVAYLYHDLCLLVPEDSNIRFSGGMSPEPSYLAQAVCADPIEAVMHLYAFSVARGLNLYEIVLAVFGDNRGNLSEFAEAEKVVTRFSEENKSAAVYEMR